MSKPIRIVTEGRKYTFTKYPNVPRIEILQYEEYWRDVGLGAEAILLLMVELKEARKKIEQLGEIKLRRSHLEDKMTAISDNIVGSVLLFHKQCTRKGIDKELPPAVQHMRRLAAKLDVHGKEFVKVDDERIELLEGEEG